ncbi:MAG TPA: hypothetical protein VFP91_17195 [Vicinamibacterales bacterium]|nr:hypothetical protein [Vicinamibacterales bacterium]
MERRRGDRRQSDRRVRPGDALDVTRIEHDNLATEVAEHTRTLQRIEHELQAILERLNRLRRAQETV